MFRPVGSQPPSVYWRRRLVFVGSLVLVIVLLIVTVKSISSGGGGSANAGGPGSAGSTAATTPISSSVPPTSLAGRSSTASRTPSRSSGSASGSTTRTSAAPPVACRLAGLAVSAEVGAKSYKVGATPMLEMQVTNTAAAPCVQDLADKQIVLTVYNGESRVWGSHDCEVQAGTQLRTLAARTSVRVTITWTGLTSQQGNCTSRQRVGAGTYTLYATLSGKRGTAAQFSIS